MRYLLTLMFCSWLLAGCVPAQLKPEPARQPDPVQPKPEPAVTKPALPAPSCTPEIRTRVVTKTIYRSVRVDNKQVLGAVERVRIPSLPIGAYDARIDTGATYSSIHADNIEVFERDGEDWVRFTVGQPAQTFELPQLRSVLIKTKNKHAQRRPVIAAVLQIGNLRQQVELNLTDRSNFEYALLVGRDFMKDNAIVDVSQTYLLSNTGN